MNHINHSDEHVQIDKTQLPNLPGIILIFATLSAVTILCHTFIKQYEEAGAQMLTPESQTFVSPDSAGVISGSDLYLSSKSHKENVHFLWAVPAFTPGDTLMLSADMKYSNVISGEKPWNRARLLLVQNDGVKDRWDYSHTVASFEGSGDWRSYDQTFIIAKNTKDIRVVAQLSQSIGSFWVKNIELHTVNQTIAYTWARRVVFFSWALFAVYLLASCCTLPGELFLKLLVGLLFVTIIWGTGMPMELRNNTSKKVSKHLEMMAPNIEPFLTDILPKLGHFALFILFGIGLSLLVQKHFFAIILLYILFLSGGTEMVQLYIDGRSPLFSDFLIDTSGGFCGSFGYQFLKFAKNTLII